MSIRNIGKQLGQWGVVLALLWGGLCLAGCSTRAPEQKFAELPPGTIPVATPGTTGLAPTSTVTPVLATATVPVVSPVASQATVPTATKGIGMEPNAFRVGDSLTIVYADLPVPTQPFDGKIKEDGTITLLQNQTFKAAGKTPGELETEIRDRYVPDYYRNMTVTVKQVESTQWYYVYGEVRSPSRQIYNNRITVLKAIASAGGFTDFANKKKVKLIRVDGRTQIVNCVKALDNPTMDLEVYPGDTIHVPRRLW